MEAWRKKEETLVERKKKSKAPYVVLVTSLLCAIVGTLLVFARGLDSDSFLVIYDFPIAALPLMFAFPLYIGFEFALHLAYGDEALPLLPFAGETHRRNVKISFFVTLAGIAGGTVGMVLQKNNAPAALAWSCLMSAPGMMAYLGLAVVEQINKDDVKASAILLGYLFVMLSGGAVAIALSFTQGMPWCLFFVSWPLVCLAMAFIGRSEDEETSSD